jgi:putative hydrolase of the HAD superfamily
MAPLRHPIVLLDVGDTLIGPRESFGAVYARVLAGLGVELPAEAWERGLRATWMETNSTVPAGFDRYRFWPGGEEAYWLRFVQETLSRAPGAPRDASLATRAVGPLRDAFALPSAWEVFDDVVPVLESLAELGAALAVVSNWDSRLPLLLDRLGLSRHFRAIVVSHLEGIEKPRPEIFLRAVARLSGRPEEAVHVGDTPELDALGAQAAGIASVTVDRRGRMSGVAGVLRDLRGLPDIVRDGARGDARGVSSSC